MIREWPEAELILIIGHALQGHYPLFGTATQYGKDSGAYPGNYNSWANVSTFRSAGHPSYCLHVQPTQPCI